MSSFCGILESQSSKKHFGNAKRVKSFYIICVCHRKVVLLWPFCDKMDNVREHIIGAAAEKMRAVGIKSISVDDICHQLGISKKTFYVYFETKEELISALLRKHESGLEESVHQQLAGKSILDMMLGFMSLAATIKDVRKDPPLLHDLQKYYPQLFREHIEHVREISVRILKQYLKQGQDEGFFRADLDIDKTASVFAYMHQELLDMMPRLREDEKAKAMERVAYGVDIFMRGIISDEGKRKIMEIKHI